MSTDPKWASDGAVSSEPHTDPMLPVITDDMLPPLANPRVPTLDDRTLAQLLAELEGEESAPPSADPWRDPLDPVEALERSRPAGPVLALGGPPALPPGQRTEGRPAGSGTEPPAGSSPEAPAIPTPSAPAMPTPTAPAPRPRHSDYRPPITAAQDEVPSLIGLTRRSQSKLGSRLFTVFFVAIFVLILIQTIVSVVSAGR
ncbi:MAG TPA: hypothetical protein VH008_11735 [Pseudonocardia sp.]|nr:hypothetical protein [Pseudonocardia sp.]